MQTGVARVPSLPAATFILLRLLLAISRGFFNNREASIIISTSPRECACSTLNNGGEAGCPDERTAIGTRQRIRRSRTGSATRPPLQRRARFHPSIFVFPGRPTGWPKPVPTCVSVRSRTRMGQLGATVLRAKVIQCSLIGETSKLFLCQQSTDCANFLVASQHGYRCCYRRSRSRVTG